MRQTAVYIFQNIELLGKPKGICHQGTLGFNKLKHTELPDLKQYIRIQIINYTKKLIVEKLVEKLSPKNPQKKPSIEL